MIQSDWMKQFACPVCLDKTGCDTCGVATGGHDVCMKSYADRVRCACGGPNKRALEHRGEGFYCSCCLTRYPFGPGRDYVDLLPRTDVGRVSHYADEEFQERLGVREGPPVLSAGVKASMASRMLGLKPGDTVLDLGSGAGKFAGHFAGEGASVCGVDMAPFFLKSAIDAASLVVGDLRRLPFRNGAALRAYSLDVLEHLDEAGVREVLVEARRAVSRKEGRIFVYTHAMESSKIASFQRGVNVLAKRLGRLGLVDSEKEALRKSDHLNAIRSHEHFDAIAESAGLKVEARVYYNVFAKAVVEDLMLKLIEQQSRKRAARTAAALKGADRQAVGHIVGRKAPSATARFVARGLTRVLMLDVALFGKVRTGPFFGVLSPL